MRVFSAISRNNPASATPSRARRSGGMRNPSWKMSVAVVGSEPGVSPPRSWWCRMVAANATTRPSAKTGTMTETSGICVPPSYGSFIRWTSPGRIASTGKSRSSRATAGIRQPSRRGSETDCAITVPSGRNRLAEASFASRTMGETAERSITPCISSAIPSSRRRTISTVAGSGPSVFTRRAPSAGGRDGR